VALGAGSDIGEVAEDTLLNPSYLSGSVTVGAIGGPGTRLAAVSLAGGAVLGAQDGDVFFAAEGGFLESDVGIVA
jgi:hypothetical protein